MKLADFSIQERSGHFNTFLSILSLSLRSHTHTHTHQHIQVHLKTPYRHPLHRHNSPSSVIRLICHHDPGYCHVTTSVWLRFQLSRVDTPRLLRISPWLQLQPSGLPRRDTAAPSALSQAATIVSATAWPGADTATRSNSDSGGVNIARPDTEETPHAPEM